MSKHVSNPLVSIILRTFNRSHYLPRCLASVLNQSYQWWELIIVDDGSTDDSKKIIAPYLSDKRVKFTQQENRGQALAFNAGLAFSQGIYVTLIDSDDEYTKDHIKLRVEYMQKNDKADLTHSDAKIIGDPFVPDKFDHSKKIHLNGCPTGSTFFAKKNVFEALHGFSDMLYSEDSDFFERAQQQFVIEKIDAPTYIYHRDTPDSICNTIAITPDTSAVVIKNQRFPRI